MLIFSFIKVHETSVLKGKIIALLSSLKSFFFFLYITVFKLLDLRISELQRFRDVIYHHITFFFSFFSFQGVTSNFPRA